MKFPHEIRDEACEEAYKYFDRNIRPLPKNSDGRIIETANDFRNNDVDAFRHAYVSGVFTYEYGELAANMFGLANEVISYASGGIGSKDERNMDLWNNSIGRKYALKTKSKKKLLELLRNALKNGELITSLDDKREYSGTKELNIDKNKSVIVINENKTNRNEFFMDLNTMEIMSRETFVSKIESGKYPGYLVASMNGLPTPVSKSDSDEFNNLG